jgi:sarcosine oxidase subunit gamma
MRDRVVVAGEWGEIAALADCRRWVLHADPHDIGDVSRRWGGTLPDMLRAASHSGGLALRLAPDEWLLIAAGEGAVAGLSAEGAPISLVDVSDRQLAYRISGLRAADLLNAGCPLDLAEAAFPPGACTRTVFGKAEIVLLREESSFRLEVARSFAPYAEALLTQAAADL